MTRRSLPVALETYGSLNRLGPEWDALFEAGPDPQSSRAWFAATCEAALPAGAAPCFVAIRAAGAPLALVPMQAGPGRQLRSLTTPYTCLFQPLLEPGAHPELIGAAAAAFGRHCRAWPMTVLDAIDPEWPGLNDFRAGLGRAGLVTRTFAHFGNWHEAVPGTWADYLRSRPGQLRETIRRKTRAAERDPDLRLEFVRAPAALGGALAAYEEVYRRSWKQPEPYERFNPALVSHLADRDVLRFGLMWAGDRPIAAQYWTVSRGRATVLKLAHDDAFKAVSPGTVLTGYVVRLLIEADGVRDLDFGRGDDPYKTGWARERRQRIGLVAFNPATPSGLASLLGHDAGHIFRFAQKLLRRSDQ